MAIGYIIHPLLFLAKRRISSLRSNQHTQAYYITHNIKTLSTWLSSFYNEHYVARETMRKCCRSMFDLYMKKGVTIQFDIWKRRTSLQGTIKNRCFFIGGVHLCYKYYSTAVLTSHLVAMTWNSRGLGKPNALLPEKSIVAPSTLTLLRSASCCRHCKLRARSEITRSVRVLTMDCIDEVVPRARAQ